MLISPFIGAIHCAFLYIAQVIWKVVSLYQQCLIRSKVIMKPMKQHV